MAKRQAAWIGKLACHVLSQSGDPNSPSCWPMTWKLGVNEGAVGSREVGGGIIGICRLT